MLSGVVLRGPLFVVGICCVVLVVVGCCWRCVLSYAGVVARLLLMCAVGVAWCYCCLFVVDCCCCCAAVLILRGVCFLLWLFVGVGFVLSWLLCVVGVGCCCCCCCDWCCGCSLLQRVL